MVTATCFENLQGPNQLRKVTVDPCGIGVDPGWVDPPEALFTEAFPREAQAGGIQ